MAKTPKEQTGKRTGLTEFAIAMAISRRNPSPGLIFHLDRGVQYASYEHQEYLRQHKIIQTMSARGDCYDNACVESFPLPIGIFSTYWENLSSNIPPICPACVHVQPLTRYKSAGMQDKSIRQVFASARRSVTLLSCPFPFPRP